ncbi:MAG: small nuclear ribonucleoprotein [Candidatus Aenigmarchaeota archaeon]|jgi:small nuclear ribonucleoprotein|nr:small nuclear ribonucleoprotein [Candidatus Aenigmarchaeota archaeon]
MSEDRPIDVLNNSKGKCILVKLKNGIEISGTLRAHDLHLNMWLEDVEMTKDEEKMSFKNMLVRGDTILYAVP